MTHRIKAIAAGLACSLLVASSATATGTLKNEPMVIYDSSGFGVAGQIHEHLAIYSSGLTSMSSLRPVPVPTTYASEPESAMTQVPVARVAQLVASLINSGAMTLGDLPDAGSDLPMKTITVFAGAGDQAAYNTFSFYDPNDPRVANMLAALDGFIFGAFGVSQLAPEQVRPDPSINRLLSLRYGQGAVFQAHDLALKFVDVPLDSRCPVNVTCVWEGEIEVVVNVRRQQADLGNLHFTFSRGSGSSVFIDGYEIHLIGVRPEARSDPPIQMEEYGILLRVTAP